MKIYIDFNIEKRTKTTNKFEKNFFKLMISSIYGNAMENLQKRIGVKLVNNEKDYMKHVSKPTFISQKIFNKNFVSIHEMKPVLTLKNQFMLDLLFLN